MNPEIQRLGGKKRAASAPRGDAGQFLPKTQQGTQQSGNPAGETQQREDPSFINLSHKPLSKTYTYKKLQLKDLPSQTEWWNALAAQYHGVNLHAELLKAMDWYRVDRVKSPKLYFRNWVEKTYRQAPHQDLTADEVRARLRVVV